MEVKKVMVLGYPVGNLWDVFKDGQRIGRVAYHGNKLVSIPKYKSGKFSLRDVNIIIFANAEQNN